MSEEEPELHEIRCVQSPSGDDRLRLLFARAYCARTHKPHGYNFHSLVWERAASDDWRTIISLSAGELEEGRSFRLWFADLYSLDPQRGWAAVKVGEGDKPFWHEGATGFHYSWRTWDLRNNKEIGLLRKCAFPLEPL